jgi:uncharacterized protein (DUF433 family)
VLAKRVDVLVPELSFVEPAHNLVPLDLQGATLSYELDLHSTHHYYLCMRTSIISCSPDVMGGTPVFAGTRVPIQTLIDYIKGGESIDDFLEGFPTVSRDLVLVFLDEAKEQMIKQVA